MDIESFREAVHQVMSDICSYPFGSFEFALLWVAALVELFFFGLIIARGLGKSERNLVFIFIGNFISLALLIASAAAVKFFFEPKIEQAWVVLTLMWLAGIWICFLWIIIFAPVLWGNGRFATIIGLCLTLSMCYGGMWLGQQGIELLRNAEDDIKYYQDKQKEATDAVKNAVT